MNGFFDRKISPRSVLVLIIFGYALIGTVLSARNLFNCADLASSANQFPQIVESVITSPIGVIYTIYNEYLDRPKNNFYQQNSFIDTLNFAVSPRCPVSQKRNLGTGGSDCEITSGAIWVYFKPNTTETDARGLLTRYNLEPANPTHFYKYQFATFTTRDQNFDNLEEKIKNLPNILRVEHINNALGSQDSRITVYFQNSASYLEIKEILNISTTLHIEKLDYSAPEEGRSEKIRVPIGKEYETAELLNKDPELKQAMIIKDCPLYIN
jgi:hypothetical protein